MTHVDMLRAQEPPNRDAVFFVTNQHRKVGMSDTRALFAHFACDKELKRVKKWVIVTLRPSTSLAATPSDASADDDTTTSTAATDVTVEVDGGDAFEAVVQSALAWAAARRATQEAMWSDAGTLAQSSLRSQAATQAATSAGSKRPDDWCVVPFREWMGLEEED